MRFFLSVPGYMCKMTKLRCKNITDEHLRKYIVCHCLLLKACIHWLGIFTRIVGSHKTLVQVWHHSVVPLSGTEWTTKNPEYLTVAWDSSFCSHWRNLAMREKVSLMFVWTIKTFWKMVGEWCFIWYWLPWGRRRLGIRSTRVIDDFLCALCASVSQTDPARYQKLSGTLTSHCCVFRINYCTVVRAPSVAQPEPCSTDPCTEGNNACTLSTQPPVVPFSPDNSSRRQSTLHFYWYWKYWWSLCSVVIDIHWFSVLLVTWCKLMTCIWVCVLFCHESTKGGGDVLALLHLHWPNSQLYTCMEQKEKIQGVKISRTEQMRRRQCVGGVVVTMKVQLPDQTVKLDPLYWLLPSTRPTEYFQLLAESLSEKQQVLISSQFISTQVNFEPETLIGTGTHWEGNERAQHFNQAKKRKLKQINRKRRAK